MSMNLEGQYEYYRCVQHDFNRAYKMINKYVTDLYLLPKKLIDTTGPTLDTYIKNYEFHGSGQSHDTSFNNVMDFINQLDEFTHGTIELFEEHKCHTDRCKAYLNKVAELNEKNHGRIVSEYAVDFIELTPELNKLHGELKSIKAKADEMTELVEQIELRWENIQVKAVA